MKLYLIIAVLLLSAFQASAMQNNNALPTLSEESIIIEASTHWDRLQALGLLYDDICRNVFNTNDADNLEEVLQSLMDENNKLKSSIEALIGTITTFSMDNSRKTQLLEESKKHLKVVQKMRKDIDIWSNIRERIAALRMANSKPADPSKKTRAEIFAELERERQKALGKLSSHVPVPPAMPKMNAKPTPPAPEKPQPRKNKKKKNVDLSDEDSA